jgi:hypothetical protein
LRFAAVLARAGFAFAGFFLLAMMFLIRRGMRRECEEDHNLAALAKEKPAALGTAGGVATEEFRE